MAIDLQKNQRSRQLPFPKEIMALVRGIFLDKVVRTILTVFSPVAMEFSGSLQEIWD